MVVKNNCRKAAYKHSVKEEDKQQLLFDHAVKCTECNKAIVGEHNPRTDQVLTFDINGYPEHKKRHEHVADTRIRTDVIHQTAIEYRMLFRPKRGDYDPVSRRLIR